MRVTLTREVEGSYRIKALLARQEPRSSIDFKLNRYSKVVYSYQEFRKNLHIGMPIIALENDPLHRYREAQRDRYRALAQSSLGNLICMLAGSRR